MSRLPRICPPGIPQHIIQRGHNRQICFSDSVDFATYSNHLKESSALYGVDIHAWVFMTNHIHLLVTPQTDTAISQLMQTLGRRYVGYFNSTYERSGTLWGGRFKSCVVQSTGYLLQCYRYIELNPVRALMVEDPAHYQWSSYRCNALGAKSALIKPHPEYLNLGKRRDERLQNYRALFKYHVGSKLLTEIRMATNKGLALGNEKFKDEIESNLSRRVRPKKPGRKRKEL